MKTIVLCLLFVFLKNYMQKIDGININRINPGSNILIYRQKK